MSLMPEKYARDDNALVCRGEERRVFVMPRTVTAPETFEGKIRD